MRGTSLLLAAIAGTLLVACSAAPPTPQARDESLPPTAAKPKVVASHAVLCDLTATIAAETIDLTCLMPKGADPHAYQPSPSDARAIAAAQLVLYGGYNFEPAITKLVQATRSKAIKVATSEVAVPKPLLVAGHHHREEEDNHEEEKEGAVPDPHVWQDARNGAKLADVVAQNLTAIAPDNAALYAQNAARLRGDLQQLHEWIAQQVATIPPGQRTLFATHEALGYYGAAYGLEIDGVLSGLSTEEQPSPARIAAIVRDIRDANVPTIFAEVTANPQLLQAIARDAKVAISSRPLYTDSLGEAGSAGDTYLKMLVANTEAIVTGLGGNVTPLTTP